jgi:hypothetical protein
MQRKIPGLLNFLKLLQSETPCFELILHAENLNITTFFLLQKMDLSYIHLFSFPL